MNLFYYANVQYHEESRELWVVLNAKRGKVYLWGFSIQILHLRPFYSLPIRGLRFVIAIILDLLGRGVYKETLR